MQQYAITINATGEVRDADGNLKSSEPASATFVVDEATLNALLGEDHA